MEFLNSWSDAISVISTIDNLPLPTYTLTQDCKSEFHANDIDTICDPHPVIQIHRLVIYHREHGTYDPNQMTVR